MLERTPIQFPPGINRAGSEAEMTGYWYDTQLVRWVEGVMRPMGGWAKIVLEGVPATASTVRAMHTWADLDGNMRTAILCDGHLYVLHGNQLTDISPDPAITPPATDLTVGGYGDWNYGRDSTDFDPATPEDLETEGYGKARPPQPLRRIIGPTFTLDNFGEDLLAMVSTDGRLLRWKPSDPLGSKASAVPTAPVANRTFVVTPERHIMLFQMGGIFNRFGWCHQENPENWAFSDPLSMAGWYELQPAGPIIAATASRFGALFFTHAGAYLSRYLGIPYIYSLDPLGKYGAPLTNRSVVHLADTVAWPSTDGFWTFNGSVIAPLACPVLDWFQRQINNSYATARTTGFYLGMQTEAWWFFPSGDATENDRYIVWNFDPNENWWSIGRLTRTCGVAGSPVGYPLMSNGRDIFRHEYGRFYYDAPVLPYAQTGAINIGKGMANVTASKGIVDTRAPANDVEFYIGSRKARIMGAQPPMRLKGPFEVRPDGKVDFRVTGRDLVVRIQSTRSGVEPWTFGQMMVRLKSRGQR